MFDKPPGLNVFVGGGNKITNVLFYMTAKIRSETNKIIPFFLLLKTHFLSGGLKNNGPVVFVLIFQRIIYSVCFLYLVVHVRRPADGVPGGVYILGSMGLIILSTLINQR